MKVVHRKFLVVTVALFALLLVALLWQLVVFIGDEAQRSEQAQEQAPAVEQAE